MFPTPSSLFTSCTNSLFGLTYFLFLKKCNVNNQHKISTKHTLSQPVTTEDIIYLFINSLSKVILNY